MKHPDPGWALEAKTDLAYQAREEGNLAFAETLSKQLLEEKKRILPPDDDAIQDEMNDLGNIYSSEGKFVEAERLISQLLAIRQRVHGPEDPDTLWSMSNLAWAYKLDGKFAEAEKLNRQCLAIRIRVLGPGNEATATSLFNLAEVLWLEGKLPEVRALFRTLLQGDPNEKTMNTIAWFELTILPIESRDTREALKLARRAASLAPNDAGTVETLALAEARNHLWDEANASIQKAMQLNTGNDSDLLFVRAIIDQGRGKMADADDHYAHAVESARKTNLTNHPDLQRLWAETAQTLGKPQPLR
jgi:Flp pilus assembly protein TadD